MSDVSDAEGEDDDIEALPEVVSLRLLKRSNVDQMSKLYDLLVREPTVIQWHLNEHTFPTYMRHQNVKLSASGVEVGGDMLFSRRVGFSGTPSDLLPLELGSCGYEKGSDGQMISVLTSPDYVDMTSISEGWSVESLLTHIATARASNGEPAFHALIDTGALVTGMSNLEVAQFLLDAGLEWADGVVFLDELDRKMVLVRATRRVLKLQQCGIPLDKRFAFYDQVHTTGMDISHRLSACAALTLGKDMIFRDYAQGAFRMRGIAKGQTIHLLVTPEIDRLIHRQLAHCTGKITDAPEGSKEAYLQAVTAWLVVNSMRSERVQFSQLCLQNVTNVWRKVAFNDLLRQHAYFNRRQFPPTTAAQRQLLNKSMGKTRQTYSAWDDSDDDADGDLFDTKPTALGDVMRSSLFGNATEDKQARKGKKAAAKAKKALKGVADPSQMTEAEWAAHQEVLAKAAEAKREREEKAKSKDRNVRLSVNDEYQYNVKRAALRAARREHQLKAKNVDREAWEERRYQQRATARAANEERWASEGRTRRQRRVARDPLLENALAMFNEPIDFSINDQVPKLRIFAETVQQRVSENGDFVRSDEQRETCNYILQLVKTSCKDGDEGTLTAEMVQTMEEEKEKQQEQEQEQEIEIEKCMDAAYSRENEAQVSWRFENLAHTPRDEVNSGSFYPAAEFALYLREPLKMPPSLFVSNNYFDKRWSGARRIKNVIMYLEWIPDNAVLAPFAGPRDASLSDVAALADTYAHHINLLTSMYDQDNSGDLNAGELVNLIRAIVNMPKATADEAAQAIALEQSKNKSFVSNGALTRDGVVDLMTSGVLTPGQNGRFYLCLSLAEAETIRRIMHARIGGPLLAVAPGLSLALRCNTNNNAVMDISNRFQQGPAHQLLMAWSALRFLNSETHFSEAALNAVLHAVDDHTPTQRQRFYHQIMGCRRRPRNRIIDTPVQRLFVIPTRFHLLLHRAIAWRIGAAITSTCLSMYDAFRAFDANKNGLLSPDELAGAVRFLRLPALTVDDILDFLSALDPSKEWNMLYKDFTEMVRDPDVPLDEGADQDPEEETSSDLPEVTPIDTELFKTRMIEHRLKEQAELKAEEAAVAGADAAYALRVLREGGGPRAGPDHSDLEAQHKKIYDPVTRVPVKGEVAAAAGADDDEDGVLGDLGENPQVNSTDRTVRWEFANGSLPSLVQPHGPNAEFITETLPDGNESTFLRLGSYTGLKFQLPFPKTVVPSTNYNFAMLVRFRRPEQTVRTRERAEQLAKLKSARAERRAKETPEERAARREEKRKAIIAAHLKAKADAGRNRVKKEEKRNNTLLFARRSALYGLPAASMTTDTTRSAATKLEEMKRAGIVSVDDVDDAVTVSSGNATAAATVDDAVEDDKEKFEVKDEDLDSGSDDDEAAQKELDAFEAGRTMAPAERSKAAQTDSNIIPSFSSAFLSKNVNSNSRPVPFLRVFQDNNKNDSQYDFDLDAVTFNYLNGNTSYNNSRGTRAFKYDEWEIISFSNQGMFCVTYESGVQMGFSYHSCPFPLSQSFGLFLSHEREDMRDVDVDIKLVMISMSMSTTVHNVLTAQRRANKLLISVPPKVVPAGANATNAAAIGKGKKTDANGDVFNATRLLRQYGYD